MARSNTGSTSNYLENASAVASAAPLTMAGWAYPAAAVQYDYLTIDSSANDHGFFVAGDGTHVIVEAYSGAADGVATTSTTYSTATWSHICGVFTSTTSRAAYLNGGGVGTNATSVTPTVNRTNIGIYHHSAGAVSPVNGRIAEVGIWNAALSANEVAALAAGIIPLFVRPESLVGYWPLYGIDSPEPDLKPAVATATRYNMTITGTMAAANHAPVIPYSTRIARRTWLAAAVAAAAAGKMPQTYQQAIKRAGYF